MAPIEFCWEDWDRVIMAKVCAFVGVRNSN